MAFVKVASISALPDGEVVEVILEGHPFAVCNLHGEIHCLDGDCPCTGGPLSQGAIRHDVLVCPWHGWRFDCKTGACAYDDSIKVATFPVRVEGGDIYIDVGQAGVSQPT